MTELVNAVLDAHVERVIELLRDRADPNESDADGRRPLAAAVETGDLACLERLLAAGADPNGGQPTPLVMAAWGSASSGALVERLLVAGADPNLPDASGTTALYAAAVAGNAGRVRALLAAGGDANQDSAGPSDGTPLCGAAAWGREDTVRALLDGGADPNQAERDGFVPLEWAVRGMHYGAAFALLEAGADPNHPCAPLVIAADRGSIGFVRVLLAHGADPSLPDAGGRTALAAAEARAGMDIERVLTEELSGEGSVEVRREPRTEGSEWIEVSRANPDGGGHGTASENGHAQVVAVLRTPKVRSSAPL